MRARAAGVFLAADRVRAVFTASATDIIITVIISARLSKSRTGLKKTDDIISRVRHRPCALPRIPALTLPAAHSPHRRDRTCCACPCPTTRPHALTPAPQTAVVQIVHVIIYLRFPCVSLPLSSRSLCPPSLHARTDPAPSPAAKNPSTSSPPSSPPKSTATPCVPRCVRPFALTCPADDGAPQLAPAAQRRPVGVAPRRPPDRQHSDPHLAVCACPFPPSLPHFSPHLAPSLTLAPPQVAVSNDFELMDALKQGKRALAWYFTLAWLRRGNAKVRENGFLSIRSCFFFLHEQGFGLPDPFFDL